MPMIKHECDQVHDNDEFIERTGEEGNFWWEWHFVIELDAPNHLRIVQKRVNFCPYCGEQLT
jgi:hypothetical protein